MSENMLKHINLLGLRVEDRVTGFKGVVSSVSFDLHGCIQAVVTPAADEHGSKLGEGHWFDVSRLTVRGTEPVVQLPDFVRGPQAEGRQGAAEKPARRAW